MKHSSLHEAENFSAASRVLHGGNVEELCARFGIQGNSVLDFSSNVNPFPLPQSVTKALRACAPKISVYPDRECLNLKKALGKYLHTEIAHLACGNGACDLIYRIVWALKPSSGLVLCPSFGEYEKALKDFGAKVKRLLLKEKNEFCFSIEEIAEQAMNTELVFLCNPNNPTGKLLSRKEVLQLAKILEQRKTVLVVDEAFIDLAEEESAADRAAKSTNLIVLRSMTKFFGLAGLRLGYAVGPEDLIQRLELCGQPWPVNMFAQKAGEAVLTDENFRSKGKRLLLRELDFLYQNLSRIKGLKPFTSRTHYILIRIKNSLSSGEVQKKLLKSGLLVRDLSLSPGLNEKFIRVAVRSRKENLRLINGLESLFSKGKRNSE